MQKNPLISDDPVQFPQYILWELVFVLLDSLSMQRLRFSSAQTPYSLDLDLA